MLTIFIQVLCSIVSGCIVALFSHWLSLNKKK
ncbi:type I toxin-antitoxin system Fst family toxin [Macrococcoides caseolyticum]